ncbi:MAG: hypothetical protein QXR26_01345 [Candidatus Caldarchaeum sp.]
MVDKGLWYRWVLQRLGLEYERQRERLFRHLKEGTAVFNNKLSARSHSHGITNLIPPKHEGWRRLTILIRTLSIGLQLLHAKGLRDPMFKLVLR